MNILVSACLLGINCRYNGVGKMEEKLAALMEQHTLIPVCPEQLGGLPTPRYPCEICNGTGADVLAGKAKVINKIGEDVTEPFIKGARESLKLAKLYDCSQAILKARSPSCGCGLIYDGHFTSTRKEGNGVCAQLLLDEGLQVKTEEEL